MMKLSDICCACLSTHSIENWNQMLTLNEFLCASKSSRYSNRVLNAHFCLARSLSSKHPIFNAFAWSRARSERVNRHLQVAFIYSPTYIRSTKNLINILPAWLFQLAHKRRKWNFLSYHVPSIAHLYESTLTLSCRPILANSSHHKRQCLKWFLFWEIRRCLTRQFNKFFIYERDILFVWLSK